MPISIGSNIAALQAQRQISGSSLNLSRVFERLSSGSRINRASDDAAGLAVSSGINARGRVYAQGVRNLSDGISALSITADALSSLSSIVIRQRELAAQSANGVFSSGQRISLDREAQELNSEYRRILEGTEFNGLRLLDGSTAELILQAGFGADATLMVETLRRLVTTTFDTSSQPIEQVITGNTFGQGGLVTVGNLSRDMNMFVLDYDGDGIDDLLTVGLQNFGQELRYAVTLFKGGENGLTEVSEMSGALEYQFGQYDFSDVFVTFSGNILRVGLYDELIFDNHEVVISVPANGNLPSMPFPQFGFGDVPDMAPTPTVNGDFNGDGLSDTVAFSTGVLGANAKSLTITLSNMVTTESTEESVESLDQASFSLTTAEGALLAMDDLSELLKLLSEATGRIGVSLSRIESARQVLADTREQLTAAESRIVDADIGADSALLVREAILQQAGASVLAQANVQPQLALILLQAA